MCIRDRNGWLGNYALGASYIALPWWAGQALFGQLTWGTALLTLAYSLAGLGIAVVNDFKSVEGDRELGLQSLPVVFGIKRASWISAAMIDVFQLAMVAVLIGIGQHFAAVLLVLLIVPQITFQDIWLLRDPVAFDVKYQASAQPFLVLGMLVTALAVGHSGHQHSEHQKGLRTGLIFHVKGHGVSQQPDVLEGDLGNDQQNQ